MARELKRIKVTPGSEVAKLLDEAATAPLLLEKDGELYRLDRTEEEDLWAGYDPTAVDEAITAAAGKWADLDADALIAAVYRARAEGSRPATRPYCPTSSMPIGSFTPWLASPAR
jgi:hypothetical protein